MSNTEYTNLQKNAFHISKSYSLKNDGSIKQTGSDLLDEYLLLIC